MDYQPTFVFSLETLNLSCCSQINGDDICHTLAALRPGLKALELWRVTSVTSVGVLALKALPELQELDIGWCTGVNAQSGCIVQLVNECPNLVKLVLSAQRQTSDRDLLEISAKLTKLQHLDILGTRLVSPNAIRTLLEQQHSMKLLDIGYCEQLEDGDVIEALKRDFPHCLIIHGFQ